MTDIVIIDTNVILDIMQGNRQAAQALRVRLRDGSQVMIARAAYNELINRAPNDFHRAHRREFLNDLGVRIAPSGSMADRVQFYSENQERSPRFREYNNRGPALAAGETPRPGDAYVAGQTEALERARRRAAQSGSQTAAEGRYVMWTQDRRMVNRANEIGLPTAPECRIGSTQDSNSDPVRGRRLMGLSPIQVAANGTVQRRPPGGGGGRGANSGGTPRGGSPAPGGAGRGGPAASSSPQSNTSARSSGVPGGTTLAPQPGARSPTRPSTRRTTTPVVGVPDMTPFVTGGPSPRGQAIGGAIELILRAIFATANWVIESNNRSRVQEALEAQGARIAARNQGDGVLMVMYHTYVRSHPDAVAQVSPRFSYLEVYFGRTRDEATRAWHRAPPPLNPDTRGRVSTWVPPVEAPDPASLQLPFRSIGRARFVRGRARLLRVNFGGYSGFDDLNIIQLSGAVEEARLFVLQPPDTVTFLNGRHTHEVSLSIVDVTTSDGTHVDGVNLDPWVQYLADRDTAVMIFPANRAAERLFRSRGETRDNLNTLRRYMHIRRMRWARPSDIEMLED